MSTREFRAEPTGARASHRIASCYANHCAVLNCCTSHLACARVCARVREELPRVAVKSGQATGLIYNIDRKSSVFVCVFLLCVCVWVWLAFTETDISIELFSVAAAFWCMSVC